MAEIELRQTTCWCGTPFALPARLLESAQQAGHTIYCPHGHPVVWRETEADKLRRERDRLKQQTAQLEDDARLQRERADKAEAANRRLKKRTAAGTCPCCQRTFQNMATHMKRQHPEFVTDTGANVVPIKQKSA
jgi:hypothetical protein